jgi:hypothetical protein
LVLAPGVARGAERDEVRPFERELGVGLPGLVVVDVLGGRDAARGFAVTAQRFVVQDGAA